MKKIIFNPVFISLANKGYCPKSSSIPLTVPCKWTLLSVRHKHWNPLLKEERSKKVLKVILPDLEENWLKRKLTVEEMRAYLKEKGVTPNKKWNGKPMVITCTGNIVDPYVPPKGDGKMSFVAPQQNVKLLYEDMGVKGRSYLALRKIRALDYNFDLPTLAEKGNRIYIDAQKALAEKNEDKLLELVTEKAFAEMMEATKLRTIRWNFIQSLEPPRIVHIRCQEMISKSNIFAQVTMRLFSQQTLAVYDRFGRLIHGSEDTLKDVLEYVVFEKYITNPHGSWKIHGKILPDYLPSDNIRDSVKRTSNTAHKTFPENSSKSGEISISD